MTLAPASTASNIRDAVGSGGGGAAGGGLNRNLASLQGYAAAVHLKIHDSSGRKIPSKLWCEIWNCDGTVLDVGKGEVMLFIDNDKFSAGGYQQDGHAGTCCVKVHDAKNKIEEFAYGLPGEIVVPGEALIYTNINKGDIVPVDVTLDPVTKGTINSIVASLPASSGFQGSPRYGTVTWTLDAAHGAKLDGSVQAPDSDDDKKANKNVSPSVIKGCKAINLTVNTTPEGLPAMWKVLPIKEKDPKAASPGNAPKVGDYGRWSSVATDTPGCWAVGASVDKGKTWVFWAFEVIDVSFVESSVGGTGPMVLGFGKNQAGYVDKVYPTRGFLSGDATCGFFSDANNTYPGEKGKGFYARVKAQVSATFQSSLGNVQFGVIQNIVTDNAIDTHAYYEKNKRQYKVFSKRISGLPVMDGPKNDSSAETGGAWLSGGTMTIVTPGQGAVYNNPDGYSNPLSVTVEFCDSPAPFFQRKLDSGEKIQGQSGMISFKTAVVVRTDFMKKAGWVAIAETKWSVTLSGTIELGSTAYVMDDPDSDTGSATSSRNPGSGFTAIGPKDIGKGGAGYEVNGPVVLDAWESKVFD